MKEALRYRKLPPEEWGRLKPVFEFLDAFLPPSYLATAAVAETDRNEIAGFLLLQAVLHAEPLWIRREYQGQVSIRHLWNIIDSLPEKRNNPLVVPGYLAVAENPEIEGVLRSLKFLQLNGTIWKKEWTDDA